MVLVPVHSLRSGMVVARDINIISTIQFNIPLVKKGAFLNDLVIKKLQRYNVSFAYIKTQGTDDIIPTGIIDEGLKIRSLDSIKSIIDNFNVDDTNVTNKILNDIKEVSNSLVDNVLNNADVSVNLINLKSHDDYTYTHSLSVCLLSLAIGRTMGYGKDKLQELATAALLHDIGKISISTKIINKPARLTENEFSIMKGHAFGGGYILISGKYGLSPSVLAGITSHHEKFDGTGYPQGLKGEAIHEYARIISIADVYDALTSDRSYRKAELPSAAIEFILGNANKHFDLKIIEYFLQKVVAFPEGSVVNLSNGKKAIVVKNHSDNIMRPTVRVADEFGNFSENIDLCHDMDYLSLTILGLNFD